MHKIFSRLALMLVAMIASIYSFAQGENTPQMADGMRSSGKIYVVVAVVVTILIGLVLYLFSLDRKISKLEKEA